MMRIPARAAVVSAAAVMSAAVAVSGQAQAASAGLVAARAAAWRVVFRAASAPSSLGSVAAISPRNAWAAGSTGAASRTRLSVLHWTGSRWRRVSVPGLPASTQGGVIRASSSTNVWLFGSYDDARKQLVRRWDGTSWRVVPVPPDGISSPVVLSRRNAWTVGSIECVHNLKHCLTTIDHWNGRTWSRSSVPTFVTGISGSAPDNVWVAGEFGGDPSAPPVPGRPVAFKWTGHAWRKVRSMPDPLSFFPAHVSAVTPRNVWLSADLARKGKRGPGYLLHWNGRSWRKIIAPAALSTFGPLVTDGSGGAWSGPFAHWTGRRWVSVKFGRSFGSGSFFNDIARIPGSTSLWGAGVAAASPSARNFRSLIARYSKN